MLARNSTSPRAWRAWIGHGADIGYERHACLGMRAGVRSDRVVGYRISRVVLWCWCAFCVGARNESARAVGTGGLLQVASYISGLSGAFSSLGGLDLLLLGG